MLSCLQRGAVAEYSSAYSIECSLQSAFCILRSPPCTGRFMWGADQRFAVF